MKSRYGMLYAISGYTLWGILPIYWRRLKGIPAIDLLNYRILFSFLTIILFILVIGKGKEYLDGLKDKELMKKIGLASIALVFNWGSYTYTMVSDKIVEASLAYYISPLLMASVGVIIFKEKLTNLKKVGISLALLGVIILTINSGVIPIWGVIIALSFAVYGSIKKSIKLNPFLSLLLELTIMIPFVMINMISGGLSIESIESNQWIWLVLVGAVTVVPLLLFVKGAQETKMLELAILQYIYPSLSLIIGVILYKEPFTSGHLISFVIIWTGIGIFLTSFVIKARKEKRNKKEIK